MHRISLVSKTVKHQKNTPLNNTVQSIIKDERGNHYQEVVFKTHKKVFALQKSQSIKKRMAKLPAVAYLFFRA